MKPKIKKTKVKVQKIAGDGITDGEPIDPVTGLDKPHPSGKPPEA